MRKSQAASLLAKMDLGTGVAETDTLLETARIETSVFEDLLSDRVDLIPGTKGSGKTALYRMFVDFLPSILWQDRRIVVAHGVQQRQDVVFMAYKEQFDKLSEDDFIDFWCIYLISLSYEQFIRDEADGLLNDYKEQVSSFRQRYHGASIPELEKKLTLKEIVGWVLAVLRKIKPTATYRLPGDSGQLTLTLGNEDPVRSTMKSQAYMPMRIGALVDNLEYLLEESNIYLWLMIDRLDELFARRSKTEQRALRGLLKTLRLFRGNRIRVKVFLRDDILEHVVATEGFAALSHIVDRRSDTLRWTEDQILSMITRRIYSNDPVRDYFDVDSDRILKDASYRRSKFYLIFSDSVHRQPNQSSTLRWIYNHTKDGRGVVTPRDVITLMTRAFQQQRDIFKRDPEGETDRLVYGQSITYGLEELSKEKRTVYLEAEFPHQWPNMRKLVGGGTEYSEESLKNIYGTKKYKEIIEDFLSVGLFERATRGGMPSFKIPFLYRRGMECTQRYVAQ